jgi:hypothetical protein
MFKKIMITCDEATTICDKGQYGEASFLEKIKLNFHFLLCKFCAKYGKQNKTMTAVFKMKAGSCKEEIRCLSIEDKELLKRKMQEVG